MWVQKIPEFHSGHILKQEMMVELSTYLYHLGPLLYQNCMDGIVSGCALTTTEDSIVVNPGVIRYEGELYLMQEPQLIHYTPTNTTRVLNIVFHDQVKTDAFVTREMELAFTEGAASEARYLELCRESASDFFTNMIRNAGLKSPFEEGTIGGLVTGLREIYQKLL